MLRRTLDLCVRKTRGNIVRLADEPKSGAWSENGQYFDFEEGFFEIGNWTASFFTGMALLAWRETEDEHFLKQALRLEGAYRDKVFKYHLDTHHDLGFLYSLYSVALYRLTGNVADREVGLRAADLLAQRFNPQGSFIRAWGRMDEVESPIGRERMRTDNMAIIDSLMNLPLLYWASEETGSVKYREIAMRHADMCLKCFVRADGSVNNIYRYHPVTWAPLGDPNSSFWARGAAWAIYGFALGYRYTRQERYLKASRRLARRFVESLDAEMVPWNDFHQKPGPGRVRDASAGAIAICGFQELEHHRAAEPCVSKAKASLLKRLCSSENLDESDGCPGIQRGGQGGKNGYTSWGDYYLMEAVNRELRPRDVSFW
jgi:unsaturated chondroitin disaccharide hydrolase